MKKRNYRKRTESSSEEETEVITAPQKKIPKRGVSAGELLKKEKPPSPKIDRDEAFGGLVLPEDYKTKLETVGIIKHHQPKQETLEVKTFVENGMAKLYNEIVKEPRIKLKEEKIVLYRIPESQLITSQTSFEKGFIKEVDLGDRAVQQNKVNTEKAIQKANEKVPLTDMSELETFPQTVEIYKGWRMKVEDATIQTISGIANFKLYKGFPTEKVPFTKFKKRKVD